MQIHNYIGGLQIQTDRWTVTAENKPISIVQEIDGEKKFIRIRQRFIHFFCKRSRREFKFTFTKRGGITDSRREIYLIKSISLKELIVEIDKLIGQEGREKCLRIIG